MNELFATTQEPTTQTSNEQEGEKSSGGININVESPQTPETALINGVFGTLNEIIKATKELEITKEHEATKRAMIRAQKEVIMEKIRAEKEICEKIIDKTFEERKMVIYELLERLDKGIETNDTHLIDRTLGGIVGIVKESPFSSFERFDQMMRTKPPILDL